MIIKKPIGIGITTLSFGYKYAKAPMMPKIAPEAPTSGIVDPRLRNAWVRLPKTPVNK